MVDRKSDRSEGNRIACRFLTCLTVTVACLVLPESSMANDAEFAETTEGIRGHLEAQFKAVSGLGFKAFNCQYPKNWPAGSEIVCNATDEENDRFIYRLIFAPGQDEPRVSMIQPVSQLDPSGLAAISRPCDAFFIAFAKRDWGAALATLSPELQRQLGLDGLRETLAPLRDAFGNVANPAASFYATPSEGLHQLEYTFNTEQGEAVGRFRMRFDGQSNTQIVSFLLTAEPGSRLQSLLMEEIGKKVLAQFFDQPVQRIDGRLDSLMYVGDNIEVNVILEDGTSILTRVEQHGTTSDIDSNDYRFQVLDAKTLIDLHTSSSSKPAAAIECPIEAAPDGGSVDCAVTFADGSNTTLRLMRFGGEHRLVELD